MPAITVIESIEDLDLEPTYSEQESGGYSYTTKHLITTLASFGDTVTEADLKQDPAMPVQHVTLLPFDLLCTCRTRQLKRWENSRQWYLTVKWSTHTAEEKEETDPFARAVSSGRVRLRMRVLLCRRSECRH